MALPLAPGGLDWDQTFALEAEDGVGLRAAVWNAQGPRGHIVFCTGRTEFLEKVAIPAAAFARRGFAVAAIDWRGQGLSDRLVDPPLKGHVAHFTDYHLDLAALLASPQVKTLSGPRLLVGHSMGGAIALGALARDRIAAEAVLLSAPLLDLNVTRQMRVAARVTILVARLAGRLENWPPLGEVDAPYVFSGFEGNVLTSDRAVFDWMVEVLHAEPGLQLAMPTLGWMAEAVEECRMIESHGPLGLPGLCLLGSEEAVVSPAAVREGAARLGCELVEIEDARHEILIERAELRAKAWTAIDRFLDTRGL